MASQLRSYPEKTLRVAVAQAHSLYREIHDGVITIAFGIAGDRITRIWGSYTLFCGYPAKVGTSHSE